MPLEGFTFISAITGFVILSVPLASGNNRQAGETDPEPVIIDYFYEPGCPDCIRVRDQIMPELKERFEGFYVINKHDVGIKANVIKLITYQEKLGITKNEPVCMVVDYRYVFNGFGAIKKRLFNRIDECVAERVESGRKAPKPIVVERITEEDIGIVEKRLKRFTVPAIVVAGLIDGINPCAIATYVLHPTVPPKKCFECCRQSGEQG